MTTEPSHLLAAIAADPDAIENWLVYADWLTDRGDPRGELIVLELAIETKTANEEAVDRHRALLRDESAWLSPRLEAEAHHLGLELWRGFIRSASVFGPPDDPPIEETVAALFADPHACLLRQLELEQNLDLVGSSRSTSVRELRIWSTRRELLLATTFPKLAALELTSALHQLIDLERIEHPLLADVRLDSGVPSAFVTGGFDLPNLQALSLRNDPMDLFEKRGILTAPPPRLAELTIEDHTAEVIAALCRSPLCAQLRKLTIDVDAQIIDALAHDPEPLRHVELHGRGFPETNEERDELRARIASLFPKAVVTGIGHDGEPYVPGSGPSSIEPVALQGIGDAVMRLVEKMKARMPKP
jgi:uncharacterized protein (TIGR02996 family)